MGRHTRKRHRTRISRPLIAALGVTIAVGGGAYLHNIKKTRAAQTDKERISLKAVEAPALDVKPVGQHAPSVAAAMPAAIRAAPSTGSGRAPAIAAPPAIATPPAPRVLLTQTPSALKAAAPPTAPASNTGKMPVPREAPPVVLASASVPSNQPPLVEGKAKMEAGQWIAARGILNAALASGRLNPADAASARRLLSEISLTVLFSNKPIEGDPAQTLYQVKSGDRLARIAERSGVTWELLCRINGLADPRKVRAGQWIKVPTGPFHCVITKSDYRLDVYLGSPGEAGSIFVTTFQVGLGKDNSTPTGMWIVGPSAKAHPATYYSPRGEGVIAADDPKNPLGGYWLGLNGVAGNAVAKNSYGIHGTIEPDSIGKQASMGCIRLRHDDIALLYDLLVEGKSKVVVKD